MKKAISLFLTLTLCLSLCACGSSSAEEAAKDPAEEPQQVPILESLAVDWLDSSWQVGEDNISVNEFGQIVKYKDRHHDEDEYIFSYNENGALTTVTNASTGKDVKKFTYTDGLLTGSVYNGEDGYKNDAIVELQKNDSGKVTAVTEYITYTRKDGSTRQRVTKHTYEYGDNGQIAAKTVSFDGKVDHITTITYDESGNLSCYSNINPETGEIYLKVAFTYTMADESSASTIGSDSFTDIYNWENILNFLL